MSKFRAAPQRKGVFLTQAQLRSAVHRCSGRPSKDILRALINCDPSVVCIEVRGYLSPDDCQAITANFMNAEKKEREDGVPATQVGDGAYGKTPREQFRAYQHSSGDVARLFEGSRDLVEETNADLHRAARRNQRTRPLTFDGLPAAPLRVSAWRGTTPDWLLKPHDDWAQTRTPELAATEFSWLSEPIAINIYPSVASSGGQLRLYGWMPSPTTRASLGLSETGYPYPDEVLQDIPWVDIEPQVGTAIFVRGAFVHGVRHGEAPMDAPRIVVNGFAAQTLDKTEILRWC